ncbi:hypothetical protein KOR42_46450 [Thalassoglobus neptunius]|uniref:Uncharacterized protein n=1 Tax=Thalassoglobus neptunius TaxID=1938619 RepID=A0A5C5VWM5_9PLAN|nr:hypothetical protein [Thalassoglobus neptunius]TWT42790.1 hypothetical protein KOR42_46450 [Thalassoglobus neptunius]
MTDERKHSDFDEIDDLVRNHLDEQTLRFETTAFVDRLVGQLPKPQLPKPQSAESSPSSRSWGSPLVWSVTTALGFVIAFLIGRSISPSQIQAATILRDVSEVHTQPMDRCYDVHFAPDPAYWNERNPFTGPSDTVLWTRGDRFWADATVGKIRLVYGRDGQGKVWVSPDRSTGIQIYGSDEELPEDIAMFVAINSMTVPSLIENVLADFDLRADGPLSEDATKRSDISQSGMGNSVIWATLKPGRSHSLISSALLEVDETDTLVRLILWTVDKGEPRGVVSFTLVNTDEIGDEQYQLTAHLDPDAEIRVHRPKREKNEVQ